MATVHKYKPEFYSDPTDMAWTLRIQRIKGQIALPYEWRFKCGGCCYQGRSDTEEQAYSTAMEIKTERIRNRFR